ncbi:hypothetical protein Mycch_2732 [Mycolicibacterium chubuense NBB4]|uniref:PASTA domain-containing protein n=1 Tax=Mycolicibacterium chubuense (strain NBB4) TaxID=710421 RepID=I4BJN6_MYCCN|nr:hypothetical protein [Mycolicibacterium chubuense]AFM17493.1 hypothetical protein Mycch_2732 [Mycolicibacterium chubuense NBB4]
MRKLVVLSGGLVAAGTAALIGAGVAISQPAVAPSPYNVTGEQYGRALAILKSQGVKAYFGGSRGSVLPQSACLVDQQKVTSGGRMLLSLDCTQAAADQIKANGSSGGPTVGANGITTVTPTPIVPIAGAPGAGAPVAGAPPVINGSPR